MLKKAAKGTGNRAYKSRQLLAHGHPALR